MFALPVAREINLLGFRRAIEEYAAEALDVLAQRARNLSGRSQSTTAIFSRRIQLLDQSQSPADQFADRSQRIHEIPAGIGPTVIMRVPSGKSQWIKACQVFVEMKVNRRPVAL